MVSHLTFIWSSKGTGSQDLVSHLYLKDITIDITGLKSKVKNMQLAYRGSQENGPEEGRRWISFLCVKLGVGVEGGPLLQVLKEWEIRFPTTMGF